jgi:hypothetical protein
MATRQSDTVKYKNFSDWQAVRAAGGDAGRRPRDPMEHHQPIDPSPVVTPLPPWRGGLRRDDDAEARARAARADRALERAGIERRTTTKQRTKPDDVVRSATLTESLIRR